MNRTILAINGVDSSGATGLAADIKTFQTFRVYGVTAVTAVLAQDTQGTQACHPVPMEVVGVRVEVPANTPVVLLREKSGKQRLLPILIGSPEASSIHTALEGIEPPRPLTHDLLATVIGRLLAAVEQIVVTDVRDHVFYAELHLTSAAGTEVVSCRPSDAIALAVRTGCPIFATESLLQEAGQVPPVDETAKDEAIIDEFRDFLDDLSPEDFES